MRYRDLALKICTALVSGGLIDAIFWAHHKGMIGFLTYLGMIGLISPLLVVGRELEEAVELSFLSVASSILIALLVAVSPSFVAVSITEDFDLIITPLIILGVVHFVILLVGVTSLAIVREFLLHRLLEEVSSLRKPRRT